MPPSCSSRRRNQSWAKTKRRSISLACGFSQGSTSSTPFAVVAKAICGPRSSAANEHKITDYDSKPLPLEEGAIRDGLIIAVKVVEHRALSPREKTRILPAIACLGDGQIWDTLELKADLAGLFPDSPRPLKFGEYGIQSDDDGSISYRTWYRQPDSESTFCVLSNGKDDAVVYLNENLHMWHLIGVMRLQNLTEHLRQNGFVDYLNLSNETAGNGDAAVETDSDVSDYWKGYDVSLQDAENGEEEPKGPQSAHDSTLTRVIVRNYTLQTIKGLFDLYKDHGVSQCFCQDVLGVLYGGRPAHGYAYKISEHTAEGLLAYRHLERTINSLLTLNTQLFVDRQGAVDDMEMGLLEIEPELFSQLLSVKNLTL